MRLNKMLDGIQTTISSNSPPGAVVFSVGTRLTIVAALVRLVCSSTLVLDVFASAMPFSCSAPLPFGPWDKMTIGTAVASVAGGEDADWILCVATVLRLGLEMAFANTDETE